jgi:hypothetical protein
MSKQRWQFIIQVASIIVVFVAVVVFFHFVATTQNDPRVAGFVFWYVGPVCGLALSAATGYVVNHFFQLPE